MPRDENRHEREARIFRMFAFSIAAAAITFGLLNLMNVIRV